MPVRGVFRLLAAALFVSALSGQTSTEQTVERALPFTHTQSPQAKQELINVIRTMTQIQPPMLDDLKTAATWRGTAAQIAIADWLFRELDGTAYAQQLAPSPMAHEYLVTSTDEVVRVFYLANTRSAQGLQDIVNAIRTVTDTQRMFPYSSAFALVMRGTPGQAASVEWLVRSLDLPVERSEVRQPASFEFPDTFTMTSAGLKVPTPNMGGREMRVFYLANMQTPQQVQEIVNAVRTISDVQRMFPYAPLRAIVLRATNGQIALIDWLLKALDQPADAAAARKAPAPYPYPWNAAGFTTPMRAGQEDSVIRVFYIDGARSPEDLQEIVNRVRTSAGIARIFPYSPINALLLRGNENRVAQAEQLIQAAETPAAR